MSGERLGPWQRTSGQQSPWWRESLGRAAVNRLPTPGVRRGGTPTIIASIALRGLIDDKGQIAYNFLTTSRPSSRTAGPKSRNEWGKRGEALDACHGRFTSLEGDRRGF